MDEENGQNYQADTPDLNLSAEKSKALLNKSVKQVQNGGKKAAKAMGPKLKAVKKMQAVKKEMKEGTKKIAKGTSRIARGAATRGIGLGAQAAGKAIKGAASGAAAIPYVGVPLSKILNTIGAAAENTGKQIENKGKRTMESGKKEIQKGAEQIAKAPQAKPGSSSSSSGSGDEGGIPKPDIPTKKEAFKQGLKQVAKRVGLLLLRHIWIFIIPAVIIIIISMFIEDDEEDEASYNNNDNSNVPYVVTSQVMNEMTIVANADGGYSYGFRDSEGNIISLDEALDNALDTLRANGNYLEHVSSKREVQKELLKRMIEAEIATQYPDLSNSDSTKAGSEGRTTWGGETITNDVNGLSQNTYTFSDGSKWIYCEYVPETVSSNKPLIVYTHGNGHQGDGFGDIVGSSSDHSFSYLISQKGFKPNAYVLEPQLPSGHIWNEADCKKLKELVDHVVEKNGINKNRISLWGFSMGAERTEYNIALYPGYYSCLVLCARSNTNLNKSIPTTTPIYCVYDKSDGYCNSRMPKLYNNLTKAGFTNIHIKRLEEGLKHYETVTRAIKNPEIFNWAINQSANGSTFVDNPEDMIDQSTGNNSSSDNTEQTNSNNNTNNENAENSQNGENTDNTQSTESSTENNDDNAQEGENSSESETTDSNQSDDNTDDSSSNLGAELRPASDYELNGSIKIQRKDEQGNVTDLTYVNESAFNTMLNSNSDEVLKYYTLKKTTSSNNKSTTVTGDGSSDALFNFIASWENGFILQYLHGTGSYSNKFVQGYITQDGKEYICRTDEGLNNGTKNYGYGVMIWRNGVSNNVSYFADEGIDITDPKYLNEKVSTLSVDIVNRVSMKIQADDIKMIDEKAAKYGVTLSTTQKHALVDAMYNFGPYGANLDKFMELYKQYGNTQDLIDNYRSQGGTTIFRGGRRSEARGKLFSTGEYTYGVEVTWPIDTSDNSSSSSNSTAGNSSSTAANTSTGTNTSASSSSSYTAVSASQTDSNGVTMTKEGNFEFVAAAVKAHQFIREQGYTYQGDHGGRHLPVLEKSQDYKGQIDCSAYVSMALDYYGKKDWNGYPWELTPSSLTTYGTQSLQTVFKGSATKVSEIPNLASGDIVIIGGHTQIFYGYNSNGVPVWLNAGSTGAIQKVEGTNAYDIYQGFSKPVSYVFRVPGGSSTTYGGQTSITSLDNFLFIGDSRYSTIDNNIAKLGNNIKNAGVGSSRIDEWVSLMNNGGKGTVHNQSVDITGNYSGISVQLGANSVYNRVDTATSEMKDFLNKLKELHPGTPIFVNSCLSVNGNAPSHGYKWDVTTMKNNMKALDQNIKAFCEQTPDLYFVDISKDLEDENGFVKLEYENDGLHCNPTSAPIFAQNIKDAILSAGASTGTNSADQNNTNSNSKYVLVVANKKTTTTSVVDNYEYSHSYGVDQNNQKTSGNVSQHTQTPGQTNKGTTTEISFSKSEGDFQEGLKKYTLYFDYSWAFFITSSRQARVIINWTGLAKNSEVIVTSYNQSSSSSTSNTVSAGTMEQTTNDSNMVVHDVYNIKETTTVTTNTLDSKLAVTKADTWLVDYENDADSYSEFQSKSKEKIIDKTDLIDEDEKKFEDENPLKVLAEELLDLTSIKRSQSTLYDVLKKNDKVSFMIDVHKYILSKLLNKDNSLNMATSDSVDLMDTSAFDLSNPNLVAERALLYDDLNISDEEKELLYKAVDIICADYGDDTENTERKKMVASAILNRVVSSKFPNSVGKVLSTNKAFPNLDPLDLVRDRDVADSTKTAVDEVLTKGDCSNRSVYVLPKEVADKIELSDKYKKTVENDSKFVFYVDNETLADLKKYEKIIGYTHGSSTSGSYASTELARKMVEWAEAQVGKSSYTSPRSGGSQISKNYCAAFVHDAYAAVGLTPAGGNGIDCPHPNPIPYNDDGTVNWSQIPVGACIVSTSSSVYGHAALYVGNGYVIEAGANTVCKNPIDKSWGSGRFVGWGYDTKNQSEGASKLATYVSGRGSQSEGWNPNDNASETGVVGYYTTKGRTYNVYSQSLGPWKDIEYSHGKYRGSACGGTSAAIIVSGKNESVTPIESGQAIYRHCGKTFGTHAEGITDYDSILSVFREYGIRYEVKNSPSNAEVLEHLQKGLPILTCVHNRKIGRNSYEGHYLTLLGVDDAGRIFLGDPARDGNNCDYHDQSTVLPIGWSVFVYYD